MIRQKLSQLAIGEQFFLSEDNCRQGKEAIIKLDSNYLTSNLKQTNFCVFSKTLVDDCAFTTARTDCTSCFMLSSIYYELGRLLDNYMPILDSMIINLQSLAGDKMYGEHITKFGLLTIDQYNKYVDIISSVQQTYWLATPTGNTSVMCVTGKGNITANYTGCLCSVRPTICLNNDTIIYTKLNDDDGDKPTVKFDYLSMFTTEQLLQELERRKSLV